MTVRPFWSSISFVAFAMLLAGCNGSSPGPAAQSPVDQQFIVGATQASNAEIGAAKIALQKTANADIIAFANEMITQHTQEEQAIVAPATAVSTTPPPLTSLNPTQQQQAAALQATPEPAFDALYINGEITGHQANIASNYDPEIANGLNAQVVQYAKTYLPQVQMHLQMATTIKTKYGF